MNGGTITGNKAYTASLNDGRGGGINVYTNSAFIMNGGVISDNQAFHTGGVAIYYGSTFTMNGGTITNNEADHGGGGVRVLYTGSTFTMNGGVISANSVNAGIGGGAYVYNDSYFTMNGGAISGNDALAGGGVAIAGTGAFSMNGGSIADNTSSRDFGGGIGLVDSASFTMHGGIIRGNTATAGGGGVAVYETSTATFKKEPLSLGGASGIIYGNDGGSNSNTATAADTLQMNLGHAVYIAPEAGGPRSRETTVTAYQSLDSTASGPAGGWVE
jgi:hypothetical protein